MSHYNVIEKRYSQDQLRFLIETLEEMIEKCENGEGWALQNDNVGELKRITSKFKEYYKKLMDHYNKFTKDSKEDTDTFVDFRKDDNELYLKLEIGTIMPTNDYILMYFYLQHISYDSLPPGIIATLRNFMASLEREICEKVSHKYLCEIDRSSSN